MRFGGVRAFFFSFRRAKTKAPAETTKSRRRVRRNFGYVSPVREFVRPFQIHFTDSRDCLLCEKENLRTKSRANAENHPNARVIGRARNQISQSLSRGVLAVAWRFFSRTRCFAVFSGPTSAPRLPFLHTHLSPTQHQTSTMACIASTFTGSVAALKASKVQVRFARRNARARRASRLPEVSGNPRSASRTLPRRPAHAGARRSRRAREPTRAGISSRPAGADGPSPPHQAGAAGFRRRTVAGNIQSTASAAFPDTPTAAGTRR